MLPFYATNGFRYLVDELRLVVNPVRLKEDDFNILEQDFPYYSRLSYRHKKEFRNKPGRILTFDLLLDIMGDVKSVFAKVKTVLHPIEGEDLGAAIVTFENKALGNITASTALYPGLPERLEIFGKNGSAVLEAGKLIHWSILGEESTPISAGANSGSGAADPMAIGHALHKAQWKHYLKAVESDGPVLVEGKVARKSVELIRAIYKSSELEKEVEIPFIDHA